DGTPRTMQMGCYGIGVTRVVAAAIEQHHDERGIIWPEPIAPFDVVVIPSNMDTSARGREAAETAYAKLTAAGFDVLLDDRPQRPGFKFADADLLGLPHRVVIAEKALADGLCEYKARRSSEVENVPLATIDDLIAARRRR